MSNSSLVDLDRKHLIHPLSNFRSHERNGVTVLKSGKGAWLKDKDGQELLDAFSGLWCVNAGYGQKSLVQAATEQLNELPYATEYFGYGSEPSIRLARKLVEITPASLQHVYFSLGGSDAVDSAIRYITMYYNSIGKPNKKHFIAVQRGFHGSSSVGAGLTGLPAFHTNFNLPLENQHHIPCPYPYRSEVGQDPEAIINASTQSLRNMVNNLGNENVAAFFCEPIMGSGGVIIPPVGWLKAMQDTCHELDILFLVDEVITGFGRTGPLFACEAEGVEPDLMTMAKGLTSGYVPMGALMMSEQIYAGIADGNLKDAVLGHGYTYSGHPVSAAVALEAIRLYTDGGIIKNGQSVAKHFAAGLEQLQSHPLVGDTRSRGMLGAVELVANKQTKEQFDPALKLNERIGQVAYENGLIFRAFADNILGFAPALCYTEEEFSLLFEKLTNTLNTIHNELSVNSKAV